MVINNFSFYYCSLFKSTYLPYSYFQSVRKHIFIIALISELAFYKLINKFILTKGKTMIAIFNKLYQIIWY